jgi:hypothetical protein
VNDGPADPGHEADDAVARFVDAMEAEDRTLLVLRDQLYEGDWQDMRQDLLDRREGKPYILKLAQRISLDVERIDRLWAFEREHDVNLADYLQEECEP